MKRRENRWFLRGVVTYGDVSTALDAYNQTVHVCDGTIPSFYIDLTWYMDWIVENVDFSP